MSERKLRAALKRSMIALDDWICVYASDMCGDEQLAAARKRISEYGTLAYIADVQRQNHEALRRTKTR